MVQKSEARRVQRDRLYGHAGNANNATRTYETVQSSARRRDGHGGSQAHAAASQGLTAMFGLDPRAAVLTIVVDLLLFGGDLSTLGLLIPVGVAVAVGLGGIVYLIQTHWYHDDRKSALIKSATVALLTAIPVPIAPLFAVPGGLLGVVRALRRR